MKSKQLAKMVHDQMMSDYDPNGSYTGVTNGGQIVRDVDDD